MSADPEIFISHKHSDRAIAETLARFMRTACAGNAHIHLSSSPDFDGPRFGHSLNAELKRALGHAELITLVYTTELEDWSYCMWECGVATDPNDQHPTSVVVLQCTSDRPKPFADQHRVDTRSLDSVKAFVKALLTTTDLFPRRQRPITGFKAEGPEIEEFAGDLHTKLAKVLPSLPGPVGTEPTSPYLKIHLAAHAVEQLRGAYRAGDADKCVDIVEADARITEQIQAHTLFDMRLDAKSTLGDVLANWRSDQAHRDEEPRWFSALTEQITAAVSGRHRAVKWAPYQTMIGRADVPFVAAFREDPTGVELDVYIVPIAPRPVHVRERMLPIAHTYHKDAAYESLDQVTLAWLIKDMEGREVTRLPVLKNRSPMCVVHKATINEFLARRALDTGDVRNLTLADLLEHQSGSLRDSFVEMAPDATMEEALEAMNANDACQDVYITDRGAVIGWLTNVMFIE
jgi:hypothetical protein